MSDGAHLDLSAENALEAVLGGKEPYHIETAAEMRDRILAAVPVYTYDGAATYLAKLVLIRFIENPPLANISINELWDTIKPTISDEDYEAIQGFTGFMWGWAVNAARRCVELGPVQNPAILEF